MTLPRDNTGCYLLDGLPRLGGDRIAIDVHYLDTLTGERRVEPSEFGTVERSPCLLGEDWHGEDHDVFAPYWWEDGSMGCDCNRGVAFGVDVPCNSRPNRFVIEKITPEGMPDAVLYQEPLP